MTNPIFIVAVVVCFLILICIMNNPQRKYKEKSNFSNIVGNKKKVIGYWNDYYQSDTRSKCFDCDRTSNFKHGSNCFDCELKGGRKVDKLLNRVLTR